MSNPTTPRIPVVLRRDGLVLDAPATRDLDRIIEACQSPAAYEHLNSPWPYRREHAEHYVNGYWAAAWAAQAAQVFIIRERDDGPALGTLELRARADGTSELGYHLFPDARGRGIMTRAVALLVDWAFAHGVPRVGWEAIAGNHASAHVVRRLGFTYDGAAVTTTRAGRHAGRLAWFAHRDRTDDAPVPAGEGRATTPADDGWPERGETAEAPPLPPPPDQPPGLPHDPHPGLPA